MKKLLFILVILSLPFIFANAQWNGTSTEAPINRNGWVGIGTSTVRAPLYVKTAYQWSSSNFGLSLLIDGTKHNSIGLLDYQSLNPLAITNNSGNLFFSKMPPIGDVVTAPTTLMSINSNGNVGINGELSTKSAVITRDETSIELTGSAWGRSNEILFNAYRTPGTNYLDFSGNIKYKFSAGGNSGGSGAIRFVGNGGQMEFFISPVSTNANDVIQWDAPKMTILRNGTVSINEALNARNAVFGQGEVATQITSTYMGRSNEILFNAYREPNTEHLDLQGSTKYKFSAGQHEGGSGAIRFVGNGGQMDFFISPPSTNTDDVIKWGKPKMTILRNGNVGIGLSQPNPIKLDVNGTIHAKEIIVDTNFPLADYVFEPTYNLMPLAEVESFVKENKHLPEVPSATEVATNGINVGDMQNKLLQKVEELTLYIIEQQKQIEELKKMVVENKLANK